MTPAMRRVPAALLSILLVVGPWAVGAGAAADPCPPPRCLDVAVPSPSGLTVPDNHVRVVLPVGYRAHGHGGYPVLYLLHGAGDTYTTWTENTDLVQFSS